MLHVTSERSIESLPTCAIDALVAAVRSRISVLDPTASAAMHTDGAVFVDTRPVAKRVEFGGIPGAIVIDRTVLGWRLDPAAGLPVEREGSS